ncbi:MAG: hypothetical protein RL307_1399 [Pseudomonadota bacterium]|jgi:hypothetical protein
MSHAVTHLLNTHRKGQERLRVLSASGQLGFGIVAESFERGLERRPHFIGCDMGSIDPGPFFLGSGQMAAPQAMVRRDLELVLRGARSLHVPLIIGSAGTAGAKPHLVSTLALLADVARANAWSIRVATVASDVPAQVLIDARKQGRLRALDASPSALHLPMPDEAQLRACTHRVAQCGTDTLIRALHSEPDVVIAGRACDTAIFAALPQMLGYDRALSLHMAKIIECTSLCCEPGGRDAMLAELGPDDFILESMNPRLKATPTSVAAHALYEQASPWEVEEPEGVLDLRQARYQPLDERRTVVSGAKFLPRQSPTFKVEAATRVGARAVLMAGVSDPQLIARIDEVLDQVEAKVKAILPGAWQLFRHVYGRGAVTALAPEQCSAHEVGLVLEFIAEHMDDALTAASVFKQNLLHASFDQRLCTGGNLAFAFTPSEWEAGISYRFVVYHVLEGVSPDDLFVHEVHDWQAHESQRALA